MKKWLRHRIRLIRILFACAVTIGSTTFTIAAEKKEARVTQIVHDLLLLVSNAAAPSFSERQRRPRRSRANRQRFARRAYLHGSNVDATRREHRLQFRRGSARLRFGERQRLVVRTETFRQGENQHRSRDSSRYQLHGDGRVSSQIMAQIHRARRARQRLTQPSSGLDPKVACRTDDCRARGRYEVGRTAGGRSFQVD